MKSAPSRRYAFIVHARFRPATPSLPGRALAVFSPVTFTSLSRRRRRRYRRRRCRRGRVVTATGRTTELFPQKDPRKHALGRIERRGLSAASVYADKTGFSPFFVLRVYYVV